MDNYATHKTALTSEAGWSTGHAGTSTLTPTHSAPWLNQVERFLTILTEKQIRRGIHRSVEALRETIMAFIERHNADPKPFRWTKSADNILASIERFCTNNAQPETQS